MKRTLGDGGSSLLLFGGVRCGGAGSTLYTHHRQGPGVTQGRGTDSSVRFLDTAFPSSFSFSYHSLLPSHLDSHRHASLSSSSSSSSSSLSSSCCRSSSLASLFHAVRTV
ncbi:hypothetical protein E2C01_019131 [Portunus trituberculatus]|uniref:Uncharacterized protein n=1 Tax=Portunus trituberculatus TaxID=210409 RepID=A0A5B7DZ55_PORTR|nr:hypothetical protein [Portunus trituberculatus]